MANLFLADGFWSVLQLQYNTRVVLLGTILLGIGASILGIYLLLRRRVLIGDAIAHATLPGVALAYLWAVSMGLEKTRTSMLIGAAISGSIGGAFILALRHYAKIREDAALGIVLSTFFGAGIALLSIAQQTGGNAAGLEAFIYGKSASMTVSDVWLSGTVTFAILLVVLLLGKELKTLCFDVELARSQGWPVLFLDSLLIVLVVAITIVGLPAVGLIMIIALLVTPAASARFWTHHLPSMIAISAAMGAISCAAGTILSASYADLPSGAMIVICGSSLFAFSFVFGRQRGISWRLLREFRQKLEQDTQHFLRAAFEILESGDRLPDDSQGPRSTEVVAQAAVAARRHWSTVYTGCVAQRLSARGLAVLSERDVLLTPRGYLQALGLVRDHRLLENYMIEETALSAGVADRAADYLEHDLQPEHADQLLRRLQSDATSELLPSPHRLDEEDKPNVE